MWENQQFGFCSSQIRVATVPTRSDINGAVQPMEAQLTWVLVFAYAGCWVSHSDAQISVYDTYLTPPPSNQTSYKEFADAVGRDTSYFVSVISYHLFLYFTPFI